MMETYNCTYFDGEKLTENASVTIENGVAVSVSESNYSKRKHSKDVDMKGYHYVVLVSTRFSNLCRTDINTGKSMN